MMTARASEYSSIDGTNRFDVMMAIVLAGIYHATNASQSTSLPPTIIPVIQPKSEEAPIAALSANSGSSSTSVQSDESVAGTAHMVAARTQILHVGDSAKALWHGPRKYLGLTLVNVITETARREQIGISEIVASGTPETFSRETVTLTVKFSGSSENADATWAVMNDNIDNWTLSLSREDVKTVFEDFCVDFRWSD